MSIARRTFGQPSSRWTIVPWHNGHGCACAFTDRHTTATWLRQFRADPVVLASLRALAAAHGSAGPSIARKSNDQVLEELSWLISRDVLKVYRVDPSPTAYQVEAAEQPLQTSYVPSQPGTSQAAAPAAVPPAEADTFSSVTDGQATAAVLQNAARDGTPFCEVCSQSGSVKMAA